MEKIMEKFVIYLRVSTTKQGASGLGLEAQRKICKDYVANNSGEVLYEYIDIESGTHRNRKGLADAVLFCKRNSCTLVVAKLDRLARDVEFCFKIVNSGISIHFCDMPQVNTLLLGVFASVAQYERELTSDRTKKALAAKKERGEKTGGASDKWQNTYETKSKDKKEFESMKRGITKNARYLQNREVLAFCRIIKAVFPQACADEDFKKWDWSIPNTKIENRVLIIQRMREYRDMDENGTLFSKWNLDEDNKQLQMRIAAHIQNVRKAIKVYNNNRICEWPLLSYKDIINK